MEGVGHHVGGVLKEPQELPGARVEDQLGRAGDLPPGPGQLDDGISGALGQGLGIGGRLSRVGDKVAQDIGPFPGGGGGQRLPVGPGEEERGIQHLPGFQAG